MSVTRGCQGVVHVEDLAATGAAARVYKVSGWEFTSSVPLNDASEIGSCVKEEIAGPVETSGTLNLWWDPAATSNQGDLTIANLIDLEIYPNGSGSGEVYYAAPTGGVLINNVSRSGSVDANNAMTVNFKVQGRLATTTVP